MTYVTKLRFQSGDRAVLDSVVTDVKQMVERKGAELKGPHTSPPERLKVPQYRNLSPGDQFPSWDYTVYTRDLSIEGAEHSAREVGYMDFPDSIHVEIEVEQKKPVGHRK